VSTGTGFGAADDRARASRRPRLRGRRALAGAVVALAALLTSACLPFGTSGSGATVASPAAPPAVAVPSGSADPAPFYQQTVDWQPCPAYDGFDCATVVAPLDWADPGSGQIHLAVIRHRASGGTSQGTILVDPGGPGASGVDFVGGSLSFAVGPALSSAYDIVGFDPRGVGSSSAVRCLDDAGMDHYLFDVVPGQRGSEEWLQAAQAAAAAFREACVQNTGPLLGHIDTDSAARDMDLLRALVGSPKLDYLGYSYGTLLGARYAQLFPQNVGRMVLDGVVDPAASMFDLVKAQTIGFDRALRSYLSSCIAASNCPVPVTSVDDGMSQLAALAAALDAQPLTAADGRQLDGSVLFTAIATTLYDKQSWPYLTSLIRDVRSGSAKIAMQLADLYFDRDAQGHYTSNETVALTTIDCLDYPVSRDLDQLHEQAAELIQLSPVVGPYMGYGDIACWDWPYPAAARGPITAQGLPPILLLGTSNDPATPIEMARSLATQLPGSVLVSYDGDGHTAYNKSNQCVQSAVDDYFLDGSLPQQGLVC